mmetsp:Transcript_8068/g.19738  ORF Transcript_8068/g.19738 Transcript_8068/m.19738 type:complete len:375 (+) Transcript_8068:941-2065(+)
MIGSCTGSASLVEPPLEAGPGAPTTTSVMLSGTVPFHPLPGPNTLFIPLGLVRTSLKPMAAAPLEKVISESSRTLEQMGASTFASVTFACSRRCWRSSDRVASPCSHGSALKTVPKVRTFDPGWGVGARVGAGVVGVCVGALEGALEGAGDGNGAAGGGVGPGVGVGVGEGEAEEGEKESKGGDDGEDGGDGGAKAEHTAAARKAAMSVSPSWSPRARARRAAAAAERDLLTPRTPPPRIRPPRRRRAGGGGGEGAGGGGGDDMLESASWNEGESAAAAHAHAHTPSTRRPHAAHTPTHAPHPGTTVFWSAWGGEPWWSYSASRDRRTSSGLGSSLTRERTRFFPTQDTHTLRPLGQDSFPGRPPTIIATMRSV